MKGYHTDLGASLAAIVQVPGKGELKAAHYSGITRKLDIHFEMKAILVGFRQKGTYYMVQ